MRTSDMNWSHNGICGEQSRPLSSGGDYVDSKPVLRFSSVSPRPARPLDMNEPSPGFPQSCNQEISISKSYDCKAGINQGDSQPVRPSCEFTSFARHYNDSLIPRANDIPERFTSFRTPPTVVQSLFNQNRHELGMATAEQNQGTCNLYKNVSQIQWLQQSLRTSQLQLAQLSNSASLSQSLTPITNADFTIPPPALPTHPVNQNYTQTRQTKNSREFNHSRSESRFPNPFQSPCNINPPINVNVPPPNMCTVIRNAESIPDLHIPLRNPNLPVLYNTPPPDFIIPPPKVSKNHLISCANQIESVVPNNDPARRDSCIPNKPSNGYERYAENSLNHAMKDPPNQRQDCDYYRQHRETHRYFNLETTTDIMLHDNFQFNRGLDVETRPVTMIQETFQTNTNNTSFEPTASKYSAQVNRRENPCPDSSVDPTFEPQFMNGSKSNLDSRSTFDQRDDFREWRAKHAATDSHSGIEQIGNDVKNLPNDANESWSKQAVLNRQSERESPINEPRGPRNNNMQRKPNEVAIHSVVDREQVRSGPCESRNNSTDRISTSVQSYRRSRSRSRTQEVSRSEHSSRRSTYRRSKRSRSHTRSTSRQSRYSETKRLRRPRSKSRTQEISHRRRSSSRSPRNRGEERNSRAKARNSKTERSESNRRSRSRSKSPRHSSDSREKDRYKSDSRNKYKSDSRDNVRYRSRSRDKGRYRSDAIEGSGHKSRLERWRMNNCSSEREMADKLSSIAAMGVEEIIAEEKKIWTCSVELPMYYTERRGDNSFVATEKARAVCDQANGIIKKFATAKEGRTPFDYTANRKKRTKCSHCPKGDGILHSDDDEEESGEEGEPVEDNWMMELQLKQKHPDRLHPELWFNDKGEMNDGPLCRCSIKSQRSGVRHNIYAGEEKQQVCDPNTNNADKLYHYRVTVSPPTNFLINKPTVIEHDNREYIFEGFSLFSHYPLIKLPTCRVIRFNIQYTILYIDEPVPKRFCVGELDIFFRYLFHEVLELVDLDLQSANDKDGCPQFHIMPRFVRELEGNGKELLPMCKVLQYFINSFTPVISEEETKKKNEMSKYTWQDFADDVKGMIVVKPGVKPCAIRVDQLDRESETNDIYPDAVHFGSRPLQLCFAGSPAFQVQWKAYLKLRHLIANKPKRSAEDKRKLKAKEQKLNEMRTNNKMKRGVTVAVSSRGFYRTGIMCDMVQHAMLIPVLICHLRFHRSLNVLEERIEYKFKNRYLLQLALTHPSYRENFGTNPDHARNSLSNCGVRQPEYGDRRIHFENTRKRGINTLINIMSKLGRKDATESKITHNERLEFLGDAVVEFITSIHLYHVFPDIEEGGLATYRAALVQNQHLAHLAKKLGLEEFMLYAHGSDLCHEVELQHAMANSFEALMGALFLDGGLDVVDNVFSCVLYKEHPIRFKAWMNYPKHPLQEQEPNGDRHWVKISPLLKELQKFEYSTGIIFNHIRLLARVFTTRSMGFTKLTLGSNQRLEFLGDTVLQLITSDYLYNHFPEHHEGHLSLLRSSLVNNRTQSVVCNDIGMPYFAHKMNPKVDLKMKDRADLLEAFLGAVYIDNGMETCVQFCKVCFFPRLQYFILNQEWNDPKSKLQQCCLTLRTLDGGEPDIPIYKVIQHVGPTNSRQYTVAVYFKNERLANAVGNSIQQAEMNAAKVALEQCPSICPQLNHQKRVIAKSLEMQKQEGFVIDPNYENTSAE